MYDRPNPHPTGFEDVGLFHHKFGLHSVTHDGAGPQDLPHEVMDFRMKFLDEELLEFKEGYEEGNHVKMFDALMDLVYVAFGTAHLLGYPWEEGWQLVQHANMQKVRAQPDGSDSKRGSSYDVVKPEGWMPPDMAIAFLLMHKGFEIDNPEDPK